MIEREYNEAALGAFEAKDIEDASAVFAEDGVFIDPHSPNEEYHGPQGVRRALEWMFDNTIEQLDFYRPQFLDGRDIVRHRSRTHQVTMDGSELAYPQVFVVEMDNGHVTRWQSYLPYPPAEKGDQSRSSSSLRLPGPERSSGSRARSKQPRSIHVR
jgi:ketosteroid isomerase-like protein